MKYKNSTRYLCNNEENPLELYRVIDDMQDTSLHAPLPVHHPTPTDHDGIQRHIQDKTSVRATCVSTCKDHAQVPEANGVFFPAVVNQYVSLVLS